MLAHEANLRLLVEVVRLEEQLLGLLLQISLVEHRVVIMNSLDDIVTGDSCGWVVMVEAAGLVRVSHTHHILTHSLLLLLLTLQTIVHSIARVHLHFLLMQNVVHFVTAHPCLFLHVGSSALEIFNYLNRWYWQ